MTLSRSFFVAAGSVTGRDHRRAERDGQDGHAVVVSEDVVAAVVTDGCSSGRSSEIGARVGAAWIAALVEQCFRGASVGSAPLPEAHAAAAEVSKGLLVRLEVLARSLDPAGDVHAARIDDALLFGFLAAVVTPAVAVVFGIGDGIVVIDGAVTVLDPGPANAPPYAAYGLLGHALAPTMHFAGATDDLDVLAVATDGLAPLVGNGARAVSPSEPPSLVELAADARYARNPSLLRKRLIVLSDRGAFSDDATLAVVRRRPR